MEARCKCSMLLGEYIYGGHWPLDFGSLESDDYAVTKICIAMVYNSLNLNVFLCQN